MYYQYIQCESFTITDQMVWTICVVTTMTTSLQILVTVKVELFSGTIIQEARTSNLSSLTFTSMYFLSYIVVDIPNIICKVLNPNLQGSRPLVLVTYNADKKAHVYIINHLDQVNIMLKELLQSIIFCSVDVYSYDVHVTTETFYITMMVF